MIALCLCSASCTALVAALVALALCWDRVVELRAELKAAQVKAEVERNSWFLNGIYVGKGGVPPLAMPDTEPPAPSEPGRPTVDHDNDPAEGDNEPPVERAERPALS
jgi:hypothetical protein